MTSSRQSVSWGREVQKLGHEKVGENRAVQEHGCKHCDLAGVNGKLGKLTFIATSL